MRKSGMPPKHLFPIRRLGDLLCQLECAGGIREAGVGQSCVRHRHGMLLPRVPAKPLNVDAQNAPRVKEYSAPRSGQRMVAELLAHDDPSLRTDRFARSVYVYYVLASVTLMRRSLDTTALLYTAVSPVCGVWTVRPGGWGGENSLINFIRTNLDILLSTAAPALAAYPDRALGEEYSRRWPCGLRHWQQLWRPAPGPASSRHPRR